MAEEVADVMIYALMLAHRLEYNPVDLLYHKLQKNGEKYPLDRFQHRFEF